MSLLKHQPIYELWDQLADLPPSDIDKGLEAVFRFSAEATNSDNAFWGGGVLLLHGEARSTDTTWGWRAPAMQAWKPDPEILGRISRFQKAVTESQASETGSFIRHIMRRAGTFRTHRLSETGFDLQTFRRSQHYRIFYEEPGIVDRVCVCFPVNDVTESHFYFDRIAPAKPFSKSDMEMLGMILRGIKWFHRQLLLRHGVLAAGETFTPTESKVLPLLLTDFTEKEIAQHLGLSFDATHKHVRGIYRKLGLRNRAGMLALWNAS